MSECLTLRQVVENRKYVRYSLRPGRADQMRGRTLEHLAAGMRVRLEVACEAAAIPTHLPKLSFVERTKVCSAVNKDKFEDGKEDEKGVLRATAANAPSVTVGSKQHDRLGEEADR